MLIIEELDSPMRLFQVSSNLEIVRFPEGLKGKAIFSSTFQYLEDNLSITGISIPTEAKVRFSPLTQQSVIHLKDEAFGKAFYELYFPSVVKNNPDDYLWEKI